MPETSEEIRRLRVQRNFAAMGAVMLIVFSTAIVLPGFLEKHHRLTRAQSELEQLQNGIVKTQEMTRRVQAEILRTQSEIRNLTQPAH